MMSFSAPASYENMNGNCVCVCVRWIKGCMMFVFLPLFLDHNGSVKWIYCVLCVLVSLDWLHKTPNNDTISSTRQIPWKLKVPTVLMHKISHHFYRCILFFVGNVKLYEQNCSSTAQSFFSNVWAELSVFFLLLLLFVTSFISSHWASQRNQITFDDTVWHIANNIIERKGKSGWV